MMDQIGSASAWRGSRFVRCCVYTVRGVVRVRARRHCGCASVWQRGSGGVVPWRHVSRQLCRIRARAVPPCTFAVPCTCGPPRAVDMLSSVSGAAETGIRKATSGKGRFVGCHARRMRRSRRTGREHGRARIPPRNGAPSAMRNAAVTVRAIAMSRGWHVSVFVTHVTVTHVSPPGAG